MLEKLADVFKTIGQPTVTYVQRDSGKLDRQLRDALNERGQLCLVTGPSKTGKTTLYKEVLFSKSLLPLTVQCDKSLTTDELWKRALEQVDFERTETIAGGKVIKVSGEVEGGGKLSWKWLAEITAKVKGSTGIDLNEQETRKRILATPSPDLLIPLLKHANFVLVVEDFHYLEDSEKILLFQQWKRFIDNEVSVIVLGTTHRAVDIANSNRDLIGRISQIDVGHWDNKDLEKICELGFKHLGGELPSRQREIIAQEAVGLPIVVQQTCLELCTADGSEYVRDYKKKQHDLSSNAVGRALHRVATRKYTQFESYYTTLIRGPREKSRKYKTYELVLACFTLDPIKFSLRRTDIDHRMNQLRLTTDQRPPAASLNSTLGALKKFQERRGFNLLEWRPNEEILYIIEPSFLFYVRWRTQKNSLGEQLDLFEKLLSATWDSTETRKGRKWRLEFSDVFSLIRTEKYTNSQED
ncbi:hypothetical protein OOZ54_19125 [Rhodopseudomonas palustris]|uniref:hypothetical protein n=1 Tax=Rhodopseudomonas palustris TaxID=1076 RepID=UPI0022F0BF66|nr:hypothetical protein [Rhodopseudomonas palustris]WBU28754.1 hypothetical protein OOZ54_19125 [Rhodopseudomonas palustris]